MDLFCSIADGCVYTAVPTIVDLFVVIRDGHCVSSGRLYLDLSLVGWLDFMFSSARDIATPETRLPQAKPHLPRPTDRKSVV